MIIGTLGPWHVRRLVALALAAAPLATASAADTAPFDLAGPDLKIAVTRGGQTLPIGEVPSLATGDRVSIQAGLPPDQRARYVLVSAFLSGATNPPPKDWIASADTWKRKARDRQLSLTIPAGARQMILFLVPETGGAAGTIRDVVRGRPGEFVRATQELNQASLDRSRLDTFMAAIRAQENGHPEHLRAIAPVLARSLTMKLNADCLARVIDLQALCLLENRDSLVLADVHSSSMAETLVGAPTDLALQLSYTREAGLGYYSPYIGVIRDIARVFGAFNSPQFRYLPTLGLRRGDRVSLLLNAAPSFARPKSVLVASMPAIDSDSPPRLRNDADKPLCGAQPGLVLPVEGAPLIYSTDYARDMSLRLKTAAGAVVEVPVRAQAERGGYVLSRDLSVADFAGVTPARLHGHWGFDAFEGPEFTLQFPGGEPWRAGKDAGALVVGRDNDVTLLGRAATCVSGVTVQRGDGAPQSLDWETRGDAIAVKLPLKAARPGDVSLEIRQFGVTSPATVTLKAYEQVSRIDAVRLHAGDDWATVSGQRLDAIASVEIGDAKLAPDGLTRAGGTDRLRITAPQRAGTKAAATAHIRLVDGRSIEVPLTILPARPSASVIARTIQPGRGAEGLSSTLRGDDLLPDTSRLTFSLRAAEGTTLRADDAVEIASADGEAGVLLKGGADVRRQSADVIVATFDPGRLGSSIGGALRFRLVRGSMTGDWQPLTTLVRLPSLDGVDCAGTGAANCTLRGRDLYLIDSVAASPAFDRGVRVPNGYTDAKLTVPAPVDGKLFLRPRDAVSGTIVVEVVKANAGASPSAALAPSDGNGNQR